MKNQLLQCLLLALSLSRLSAQDENALLRIQQNAEKISIPSYPLTNRKEDFFSVKMGFEGYQIYNRQALEQLKAQEILAIDLVYTLFPKDKDFKELNLNRLRELYKIFPALFYKPNIQWSIVGQSDCHSRAEADKMFHGFVVYYRPFDTLRKLNADYLFDFERRDDFTQPDYQSRTGIEQILGNNYIPTDSLVFKVFQRNIQKWHDLLIVTDWTGSMYPYGTQLLTWLKLNLKQKDKIKTFVFFNDGDQKSLGEKVIGSTGGIYYTKSTELNNILKTMLDTQAGGDGGTSEENDLEALLYGQYICPESKDIVLIADAESYIRDIQLLEVFVQKCRKSGQKVRVILCGDIHKLSTDYLYIAYYTGGSIHTIDQDIENLERWDAGQEILIGKYKFRMVEGGLEVVREDKKKRKNK